MTMSEQPSAPIAPIVGIALRARMYGVNTFTGAIGAYRRSERFGGDRR